jgi:MinD superfamily P-loop ATPase
MQISIASGKGGTGKTTVAVNLAVAAAIRLGRDSDSIPVQILDCDVEEPNCHIFLQPEISEREDVTVLVPEVDESRCTHCSICGEVCAFHAILSAKRVLVFPELCHGCGACSYACPEKCISEVPRVIGKVKQGFSFPAGRGNAGFSFTHGILNPGEALAAPLVKKVRQQVIPGALAIIDSPPGTSCTMVASIKGSDLCILVTEPTPFGLHDLELAYETALKLGVPSAVVINRSDIGDDSVAAFCRSKGIPILAQIPLDRNLARLSAEGNVAASSSREYLSVFSRILDAALQMIRGPEPPAETWHLTDMSMRTPDTGCTTETSSETNEGP